MPLHLRHFLLLCIPCLIFSIGYVYADNTTQVAVQRQLVKHFRSVANNPEIYDLAWKSIATSPDSNSLFTILELSLHEKETSKNIKQTSKDGMCSLPKISKHIQYSNGFDRPEHESEDIIRQACHCLITEEPNKVDVIHLQYYVEFDEQSAITYFYVDFPVNGVLPYRQQPTYRNFTDAEYAFQTEFFKQIKLQLATAQVRLKGYLADMQKAEPTVRRDLFGNPVCIFKPDCDMIIDDIRTCPLWLSSFVRYGNPRRELHQHLFQKTEIDKFNVMVLTETKDLVNQGNKLYNELEKLRQTKINDFWNLNDIQERQKYQKELREAVIKELDSSQRQWRRQTENLLYESQSRFSPLKDKSIYLPLLNANMKRIEEIVQYTKQQLDQEYSDEDVDFNKIIENIEKHFPLSGKAAETGNQNVPISELEDLDIRSGTELMQIAAKTANHAYPKNNITLLKDEQAYVYGLYPQYTYGKNLSVNRKVNGVQYNFNGYLKKVGPGKIMIGSKYVTLSDLPEELRISFDPKAYKLYTDKKIAEKPIAKKYNVKKMELANTTYNRLFLQQFEKNIPQGLVYIDHEWVLPEELLIYSYDPNRFMEMMDGVEEQPSKPQQKTKEEETVETLKLDENGNVITETIAVPVGTQQGHSKGPLYRPIRQSSRRYRVK